ncbi:hypothetical protein [Mesorhizobium tamadayense]|nr:hypothetical protein [Mesorhizobium tamadayense]
MTVGDADEYVGHAAEWLDVVPLRILIGWSLTCDAVGEDGVKVL